MSAFTCPVCFYDKMSYPPKDYSICMRCGTEFGNDDEFKSHEELRQDWEDAGKPFFYEPTL